MKSLKLNRETLRVLNRLELRKVEGGQPQSLQCISNGGPINVWCIVSNGCTPAIYTQGGCQ